MSSEAKNGFAALFFASAGAKGKRRRNLDEKTKKGIDKTVEIRYNNGRARRGVAQFGRVLGLGPRCRRFKSCRLDQKNLVKLLTMDQKPAIINRLSPQYAGVAQLVEQLICNQQVGGSSPSTSSTKLKISYGRVPEWPKGADCKSVVSDFGGSNPPSPTTSPQAAYRLRRLFYKSHQRAHSAASPFPKKVTLRLCCSLVNALTTLRLATNFLRARLTAHDTFLLSSTHTCGEHFAPAVFSFL